MKLIFFGLKTSFYDFENQISYASFCTLGLCLGFPPFFNLGFRAREHHFRFGPSFKVWFIFFVHRLSSGFVSHQFLFWTIICRLSPAFFCLSPLFSSGPSSYIKKNISGRNIFLRHDIPVRREDVPHTIKMYCENVNFVMG